LPSLFLLLLRYHHHIIIITARPSRENPIRLPYFLSYTFLTTLIWMLPFFAAWYVYLPLVIIMTVVYR